MKRIHSFCVRLCTPSYLSGTRRANRVVEGQVGWDSLPPLGGGVLVDGSVGPTSPVGTARRVSERGGALIITLWVAFGLVSLALYFGHSMSLELKASENRAAGLAAEQAIEGGARYALYLLSHLDKPGQLPDVQTYLRSEVRVGRASFWFLGRDASQTSSTEPFFGLADEAGKLNLNTATPEMLQALPRMTAEFAAAIKDWRDTDSDVTSNGAEEDAYSRLNPPYKCKNANFETVEELRLVYGATLEILYGEDINRNGVLDVNENDGESSPPIDNKDGKLDPGILDYVTVYSQEPTTNSVGTTRVDVRQAQALQGLVRTNFSGKRLLTAGVQNPLHFYALNKESLTAEEFAQIEDSLRGPRLNGLVNVNTASEAVLACIPGIGTQYASSLVAYRRSHQDQQTSVAWVASVLTDANAVQTAGEWLTGRSYQFTADIAAVGQHSRGYRRMRFILDTMAGTPRILYRQDVSSLGWALGRQVQQNLLITQTTR